MNKGSVQDIQQDVRQRPLENRYKNKREKEGGQKTETDGEVIREARDQSLKCSAAKN